MSSFLEIKGWAFARRDCPIRGRARLNGIELREFVPSMERPDVRKAYSKMEVPRRCSFALSCDWADVPVCSGDLTVEIFTEGKEKLILGPVNVSGPPIVGHAECNISGNLTNKVYLLVQGWAFAADGMPVCARLSINGCPWNECFATLPRDQSLKNPAARFSGFSFSLPYSAFHGSGDILHIDFFDYQGHTVSLPPIEIPRSLQISSEKPKIFFHCDALMKGQRVSLTTIHGWVKGTCLKVLKLMARLARKVFRGTLRGVLELRAPVQYFVDHIVVEGWVYSIDPNPLVEVLVGNQCVHSFHPTIPRKDVERNFPDMPGGQGLGFSEWVALKEMPQRVSFLEVRILNTGGERQTLGFQELHALPRVKAGFYGEIEGPLGGAEIIRDLMPVRGWALFSEGLPARGEVLINGNYVSEVELYQRRDDLFPTALSLPSFGFSGFRALVDLSDLSEGPFELTLHFHSEKGGEVSFSPILLYYRPTEGGAVKELPPGFTTEAEKKYPAKHIIHPSPLNNGRAHKWEEPSLRICAASHNFNMEGAPIYLYNLLSHLSRQGKVDGQVWAPSPGELKDWFIREGFDARVMDPPVYRSADRHLYEQVVAQGHRILQEGDFHLAFANTLESFWMVEAAARAGIPCIWAIHESLDPRLYYPHNWPDLAQEALQCLSMAYALVFVSHATKALFPNSLSPRGLNMVIHTGIPLEPIDAFLNNHPREKVRMDLGIATEEIAITMVGATHPIKGQHVFLRAAKELLHLSSSRNLSFFVIGGLHGFYFQLLKEIRASYDPQGQKVHLNMFANSIEPYYWASDILVCASFNESFPLVILEGMAYGLPIVTTPVLGISEQLRDGDTGLFFQPGNVSDLVEKLERLIEDPQLRRELGNRAFRRLRGVFTMERMASSYWELCQRACGSGA